MSDMNVGRVFKSTSGWAKYRCVAKDRDGSYILRSIIAPGKCIVLTEMELLARWKVIA